MKKRFFSSFALSAMLFTSAWGAEYGLPSGIQEGNILHCFDWTFNDIKTELPSIAAAGFGSVQVSPVQGNCATNAEWFFAYMPYDFKFRANGNGSRAQLQSLCAEAEKYGIKVIVDVVANHVNQASGYHETWWDQNGRVRWEGGCNYGNRYSITHGQLGDYGDVNSEDSEVQARAKAFVEDLKSIGVKGIRWDAAKHIGLPSEGCNFWKTVTSVPGMFHYGEILDSPGGNGDALMKEYTQYMSVTDNGYSDKCRHSDGVPDSHAGWASGTISDTKVVYWGESHDDYSNEWQASTHVSQAQIDRAWAIGACRAGATALYFSRPSATTRTSIKMGQKGSVQFKQPQIAEVNKFRNLMTGKKDYFSRGNGVASVTRENGGAVIVKSGGAGNVSVANGGGYCPAGTYKDRVSGATFTVTATTISGNVGASGIAVIYKDGVTPDPTPDPNPDPDPTPDPTPDGDCYVYFENTSNWNVRVWAWNEDGSCVAASEWPGDPMTEKNGKLYWSAPAGKVPTLIIFSNNGGEKAGGGDLAFVNGATYKPDGSYTVVGPTPDPTPDPDPVPGEWCVFYDNSSSNWSCVNIHYWSTPMTTWPGVAMTRIDGNIWKFVFPSDASTLSGFLFCNADGSDQTSNYDSAPVKGHIYKGSGNKGGVTDEGLYLVYSGIVSVETAEPTTVEIYTLQGVRVSGEGLAPGIYIRREGNAVTKVYIR